MKKRLPVPNFWAMKYVTHISVKFSVFQAKIVRSKQENIEHHVLNLSNSRLSKLFNFIKEGISSLLTSYTWHTDTPEK